ncbi:hypothetical protein WT53_03385 [Burkholderia sp. MSMB2157WGS]|nr:hypothetical protein WT53_03385 [Burkholderia sp. MSMB2157WGS]
MIRPSDPAERSGRLTAALRRLSDGCPPAGSRVGNAVFHERDARPIAAVLAQIDRDFAKNRDHARNA